MMLDHLYEAQTFTPTEMLAVSGLGERNLQVMIQRGHFPRASRPGRGVRRQYSFGDLLFLAFLKLAVDAHIPLAEASVGGLYLFPSMEELVPASIMDVVRSGDRPDLAPQVFAVFRDGRAPLIVTKKQIDEAWAPIHEGESWGIVINVTRLVCGTVSSASAILARRSAA